MNLPLVVSSFVLLAAVTGCSDKPAATAAPVPEPAARVLPQKAATIDVARDVATTLGGAAALKRTAVEQSTQ